MMSDRYLMRRARLRRAIKQYTVEAFLVTDPLNVRYLTGFTGEESYLLIGKERELLLTDSRFEAALAEEMPDFPALIRRPGQTMTQAIVKGMLNFAPVGRSYRLGAESDSMTLTLFRRLEDQLKNATLFPIKAEVEKLRQIKDRSEVAAIRRSIQSAIRAFQSLRGELAPDWTETSVRNELEYRMRRFGAEDAGFSTIAAVGERAALPHAVPTNRKLLGAESLLIDWGAKRDGYVSDLTRVLILTKKPSDLLRRVYETVFKAQKAAIRAIRPGVAAEKVDLAARRVIERAGFAKAFNHGLGHGLGLAVHDGGGLSIGNKMTLAPGMVLTVEPGIYLPGRLGVRIEDDVLVTNDGCEVLTGVLEKSFDAMFAENFLSGRFAAGQAGKIRGCN